MNSIKYDFTSKEVSLIINSLNSLRNYMSMQERATNVIDEMILKISNNKIEFDIYESKILINSLNNFRYKLKSTNESCSEVNDLLLKIINYTSKDNNKSITIKGFSISNESRC